MILTVFPVLLIEALTFWATASWLGLGWALFAVFALMGLGMVSTGVEMQRVSRLAAAKRISPGRLAGDYGLLTAGAILAATPGIASSIIGLLLIFPPTRALARRVLAARLVKSIENLGVRSFEATNANRAATSYGSFFNPQGPQSGAQADQPTGEVIDESEIVEWTRNIRPEDFTGPENPENPDKPGEKG
nr:FxsA family protein [Corynebacterium lemuris]